MTAAVTPTRTLPERTLRNGTPQEVVDLLNTQHAHKLDVVVPVSKLEFVGGNLVVKEQESALTEEGFFDVNGLYRPVAGVDDQLSSIFDIPVKYLKKLRTEHLGLLDNNLNELIKLVAAKRPDQRHLVRTLWGEDPLYPGSAGVVRALLSDRYRIHDNLDTLLAVLDGLRAANLGIEHIKAIDLSDNRLYLSVRAPEISAMAPELLRGYRSPWAGTEHGGEDAETLPIVDAGVEFSNSEVGSGAFNIRPVLWVRICSNGLVQKMDQLRKVHLGGRLEEGQINWSSATRETATHLVREQVKDATETFLQEGYVKAAIERMERDSGVELKKPEEVIKQVSRELVYTKTEQETILSHFIKGGQITSGGLMQAVSSAAQVVEDVDRSHEMLGTAVDAMRVAARIAS